MNKVINFVLRIIVKRDTLNRKKKAKFMVSKRIFLLLRLKDRLKD